MYTGTLIYDLLMVAERVRDSLTCPQTRSLGEVAADGAALEPDSETEQFAQALGLGTADGDLGLLLIVHPELVGTLEPGDDFADTVDVHEVGTVRTPE